MSVINTNITSMIGQANLSKSQSSLQTSMERLSSGLRINSAKDDAAGQAIANRMSSQITGLSQAQRNANDGISVAQTAEGALNQVNDNLQRIRELSVQAQNGTNSDSDLESIQAEINQRLGEIDRISDETSFNGVSVLASEQKLNIQVGANDGEAIDVTLKKITSATLGLDGFDITSPLSNATVQDGNDVVLTDDNTTVTTTDSTAGTALTGLKMSELKQNRDGDYYIERDGKIYDATVTVDTDYDAATPANAGVTIAINSDAETTDNVKPLDTLDTALSTVDTLRSDLGAIQNRFESAITNLQTNETNLSAARSRIEDADYATEVANMTKSQILQQAGTSVLAQANQIPQNVLSLLG